MLPPERSFQLRLIGSRSSLNISHTYLTLREIVSNIPDNVKEKIGETYYGDALKYLALK